ncbi:FAD-dependent oxidoreductase, partial [Streptococcus pyogenes]
RVQKIEKCHDHFLILTKSVKRSVDVVLMCAGLRPNTHFLEDQHILANDGTIPVNAFLETKLPQVFAVGDTIKLDFLQENDPRYLPLINTAIRTG